MGSLLSVVAVGEGDVGTGIDLSQAGVSNSGVGTDFGRALNGGLLAGWEQGYCVGNSRILYLGN